MENTSEIEKPAAWSAIFFFLLLIAIIILPFLHPIYLRHVPAKWHRYYIWDSNWKKLIIGILLSFGYFIYLLSLSFSTARTLFLFSLHSFISLFTLLSALFITCTGLPVVKLDSTEILASTRLKTLVWLVTKNVLFLAFCLTLSNLIGTLAASVLLFPAFISQNASRLDHINTQRSLIIFFIILVGNCGGVLSPLGDPPLYMGYTNGVRFLFTFEHLYKIFLAVNGYTLFVFALIDLTNAILKRRDNQKNNCSINQHEMRNCLDEEQSIEAVRSQQQDIVESRYDLSSFSKKRWSWHGIHHLPFLALIITVVIFKALSIPRAWPLYLQEGILLAITFLCLMTDMIYNRLAPIEWYRKNYSTRMEPVVEVVVIFVGLLFTMSAPISVLTNMNIAFGPRLLFFISGIFSALLDNAAVYISFAANAAAKYNITIDQTAIDENGSTAGFLYVFFRDHPDDAITVIRSLSAGSVLMGGCTLIGNAPNIVVAFMATRFSYRVRRTIVNDSNEEDKGTCLVRHIEKIQFFRQMFTACLTLIPIFVVVSLLML